MTRIFAILSDARIGGQGPPGLSSHGPNASAAEVAQIVAHGNAFHGTAEEGALRAYAVANGFEGVEFVNPPTTLEAISGRLFSGDIALIKNLDALGERPSQQQALVMRLLGRGVRLHVLALHGPIENSLVALTASWEAGAKLEMRMDATIAAMGKMEAEHSEEMIEWEKDVMSRVVKLYGLPGSLLQAKARTDSEDREQSELGSRIKTAREQAGMSQQQLGELAGASKASISRLEQTGRSDAMDRVLKVLHLPAGVPISQASNVEIPR